MQGLDNPVRIVNSGAENAGTESALLGQSDKGLCEQQCIRCSVNERYEITVTRFRLPLLAPAAEPVEIPASASRSCTSASVVTSSEYSCILPIVAALEASSARAAIISSGTSCLSYLRMLLLSLNLSITNISMKG